MKKKSIIIFMVLILLFILAVFLSYKFVSYRNLKEVFSDNKNKISEICDLYGFNKIDDSLSSFGQGGNEDYILTALKTSYENNEYFISFESVDNTAFSKPIFNISVSGTAEDFKINFDYISDVLDTVSKNNINIDDIEDFYNNACMKVTESPEKNHEISDTISLFNKSKITYEYNADEQNISLSISGLMKTN